MGKGSQYRPVDKGKWDTNYLRIYGNCKNKDCSKHLTCKRYLDTLRFRAEYIDHLCKDYSWYVRIN